MAAFDDGDRETSVRIGPYALLEQIAQSHVGAVYRAVDETRGEAVVVKVASGRLGELRVDVQSRDVLMPPGIVPVRDVLHTPEGDCVLIQNVPGGQPVAEAGALFEGDYRRIARFIQDAAGVLQRVHEHGVTHGDISERTLLIDEEGNPVFSEFGMGLAHESAPPQASDAAQVRDRKFQLDERADLFALGTVMYFLLGGRRATDKPVALMSDPAAPVDDVIPIDRVAPEAPPELRSICNQALSTDPVHRYLHARTLVSDLDVYLHGRRKKPLVTAVFVVVAAMTAGLFGLWGAVGGGPARIVDAQLNIFRAGIAASESEPLEGAEQAMSTGDMFRLHVQLSKAAHLTVLYRDASGRVSELETTDRGERRSIFDWPAKGHPDANGWRAPQPGGMGVIIVIAHTDTSLPAGLVQGVLASIPPPPRRFAALTWHGLHIANQPAPDVATPSRLETRTRWKTSGDYANRIIKTLLSDADADADDVVVGLMYLVGA